MTGTFDARIVRKNESAKGLFITLEIEGTDYYHNGVSEFRPGTLLKLQYEELDGDTGAQKEQTFQRHHRAVAQTAAQQGGEETAALSQKGGDANTTPTTTETTAHAPIRQRHGEPERNNTPPH